MRFLKILLLLLVVLFLQSIAAHGDTWIVDISGQGHFTSIRAAIDAASQMDTILVRQGTYAEEIRFRSEHSGILLKGEGPVEGVVVHGDTVVVLIGNTDPAIRLEGLTITGGSMFGGLWIQGARAEIVNCIIRDNNGPSGCQDVGGAGLIWLGSDVLVEGCIIEGNHGWEAPGGLIIWSSRADIRGNIFRNNSSCYGGGLEIYHCESNGVSVVEENLFVGNTAEDWGGGIFTVDSSPVIRKNTFVDNGDSLKAAIWVLGGEPDISYNVIVGSHWVVYCQTLGGYPPSLPSIGDNACWSITDTTLSNCSYSTALRVANPLFCNPETGDYTLCADSPLIQNGEVLYGAFPAGCAECGETPVRHRSWGSLKALYGNPDGD